MFFHAKFYAKGPKLTEQYRYFYDLSNLIAGSHMQLQFLFFIVNLTKPAKNMSSLFYFVLEYIDRDTSNSMYANNRFCSTKGTT